MVGHTEPAKHFHGPLSTQLLQLAECDESALWDIELIHVQARSLGNLLNEFNKNFENQRNAGTYLVNFVYANGILVGKLQGDIIHLVQRVREIDQDILGSRYRIAHCGC